MEIDSKNERLGVLENVHVHVRTSYGVCDEYYACEGDDACSLSPSSKWLPFLLSPFQSGSVLVSER